MSGNRLDRLEKLLGEVGPEFIIVAHDDEDLSDPAIRERIEQLKREAVRKDPAKPWYVIYLHSIEDQA